MFHTIAYIASLQGVVAGIDVHSYGQLVMRSYGHTKMPSRDEPRLARYGALIALAMAEPHGKPYVSQRSSQLYTAPGTMDDYLYEKVHVPGFAFELRDKGRYGFRLPPDQIIPTGMELATGLAALSEALLS